MNPKYENILAEFNRQKGTFASLGAIVQKILTDIAAANHIITLSIEHRVKTAESLTGKLLKKGEKYRTLTDITDILGARVVCYFTDEVDIFGRAVEERFVIDREQSVDKRKLIQVDSFGYLSLHYICSLPCDAGYLDSLTGYKFEIQIRTGLQHVWAFVCHDTIYKSQFGVPRGIQRAIARVAGLLELADDELRRVRDETARYTDETRQKIINDEAAEVSIDSISLNEYMRHNFHMQAFLAAIAAIEHSEVAPAPPTVYLEQLSWLGKKTLGDLQAMLQEDREEALRLATQALKGTGLDYLSSNVALLYLCRAELRLKGYSYEKIADFLDLTYHDRARSEKQARALASPSGIAE